MQANIELVRTEENAGSQTTFNPIVDSAPFKEMVATEKSYNNSLTLLDLLFQNVDVSANSILSQFKLQIAGLKAVSDALLSNIEKAVKTTTTDGHILRAQRRQLIALFFNTYKEFALIYPQFNAKYKSSDAFKEFEAYIRGELEIPNQPEVTKQLLALIKQTGKQSLDGHLIQTIQRGPRYLMLLDAAEKKNQNVDETNQQESRALKELVANFLSSVNAGLPTDNEKEYEFGDYSRALYNWVCSVTTATPQPTTAAMRQPVVEKTPYRPGDLLVRPVSNALFSWWNQPKEKAPTTSTTIVPSTTPEVHDEADEPKIDENGFTFL